MPATKAEDLLKSFGTPNTKLTMAQKVFAPFLQLYNSFRTPDIEQKNSKEVFKLCLKAIFNNTETILNWALYIYIYIYI